MLYYCGVFNLIKVVKILKRFSYTEFIYIKDTKPIVRKSHKFFLTMGFVGWL